MTEVRADVAPLKNCVGAVFGEAALAVVVGCRIDEADRTRADAAGVACLKVPEPA